MENQHRKISGYRELTAAEIDLMNRIKEKGEELLELHRELTSRLASQRGTKEHLMRHADANSFDHPDVLEFQRFEAAEPLRWASIGKTDIQTGIMALVRAVAQPTTC